MSNYKKTTTRFSKKVRIDPKQLEWLSQNKDTRTIAGYLDKIINEHKQTCGQTNTNTLNTC